MNPKLAVQLNNFNFCLLMLTVLLTPLLVLPITSDFFEIPKLAFLALAICIMVVVRAITWILDGKVLITKTPFDMPLLLLGGIGLISAFFSQVHQISFFGNLPRVHGSAVSWLVYIAFYFLAVQLIKTKLQVRLMLLAMLGLGVVLGLLGIFGWLGLFLPFSFAQSANFSPTGSSFGTAAILSLLLPLLLASEMSSASPRSAGGAGKFLPKYVGLGIASLFGLVLALIGDWGSVVTALVGTLVVASIYKRKLDRIWMVGVPVVVYIVVLAITLIPLPSKANFIHQKQTNFPREIQLPIDSSWKISASAFRDAPFMGTGPSTYGFDFSSYKPVEYNSTPYWNISFDTAFNEFLQIFATLGALGLIAFLSLLMIIGSFAVRSLKLQAQSAEHQDFITQALAISALGTIVLLLFHVSTLVTIVITFVILAMLIAENKSRSSKVEELTFGIKASKLGTAAGFDAGSGDAMPIIIFIPILIAIGFILWKGSALVLADYHHRQGLKWATVNAPDAASNSYKELQMAEQLNPSADLYRIDLAVTNFNIANAIAANKGPNESSPAGSLTDQDKSTISTLLDQSIKEGQYATVLNPLSSQNWQVLASIYRQISGVAQNALQFSLDAYGHAITRDPLNPLLRVNVGGVYYSIKNYDLAVRFFTDSVNLKPDYANGYYNLSVALRDQGRLQDAITTGEQVVALIDPKSPDYKVAAAYLSDLKARLATQSATPSDQTAQTNVPPAANEQGPLQQKELPKVLNLPQPGAIATPSAVKKNPEAKTAEPSPSESPSESPSPSPTSSGGG